ncbi:MAG: NFACT family protein [Solobacterium sp.]|nr:NFACT family protein [Solobacterium sp.]
MALDGILLYKAVPELRKTLPARIQKIYQISATEILFQLHGPLGKTQMLISCHSQYNRILLSQRRYPTPNEPGNFIMVLRKYIEGATIVSLEQAGLDRWCTFTIRRHNEIGDREELYLIAELMGKYANVILVSSDNKIIDAMKRIPPFENSRRTIHPGAQFVPTPPQDKKNPFEDFSIDPDRSLTAQFAGFSPFLASEAEYRMSCGQSFRSVMEEIRDSDQLYLANKNNEAVFHCIPLTSVGENVSYPLFEGFDILYYHKEEKERIREISGDVFKVVRRELKHQKQKLPRLLKEADEAQDCDRWRQYGDLLYSYSIRDTKGQTSVILQDFETGEDVRIPLDPKLDGFANAQKCYTKYTKLRKGQKYLAEQIEICRNEISYFEGLLEQLEQADFVSATEIRDELVSGGYMKEKKQKARRKKKDSDLPAVMTVTLKNGVAISWGRNNLQNDALTWHMARKQETWLHAKDYHGSHVVIHSSDPDEETLRTAANIAAYFSAGRDSSSVPVNWCRVSQLKKIPGAKPGMVQLTNYKTIYIDPDSSLLSEAGVQLS